MKKYILMIAVFFSIGISGCKKDFLSLEVNPNQPSVSPPALTLAGALVTAAAISNSYNNYFQFGVWVGWWTPSGNYVPNSPLQQFVITNTNYTGQWSSLYSNLTNFNNLQQAAAKDPTQANFQAIAMIMKVYDFEQLVDQFGDVPYSQAFQPSTILFPGYDKAQTIYDDLVKQLDAAIAKASSSAAGPGNADVVFNKGGGADVATEMGNWKKFANTLKLRLAVRQSVIGGGAAKAALAATASVGYLDGTVQATVNPGYSNTLSNGNSQQSPFWANYGADVNGNAPFPNVYARANQFMVTTLKNFNDPRINRIYAPTSAGNIIQGNVFGDTQTTLSNPNTSAIGPGLLIGPTQDGMLMSGPESLFLQAEAAQLTYISGDPQALYQAGITASFVAMGLTAGQAATYYGQDITNVGWTSSNNKQEAIIYQKWIALTGYEPLQAYLDFLRTGYPVIPVPESIDPAAVSTFPPVREFYPLSELTSNATSVGKEGTINIFTSKLFWEKP